jgi:hypothetical protein
VHKVRASVLSEELTGLDLDDFENDSTDDSGAAMERGEAIARGLGKAVAADEIAFGELLAELVSGSGWLLWSFGQGLSEGTRDPKALWLRLVKQLATSVEGNQNVQILRGMLNTLHEKRHGIRCYKVPSGSTAGVWTALGARLRSATRQSEDIRVLPGAGPLILCPDTS